MSPAPGSRLLGYERIRPAEENLRRQVPALLSAQRAGDDNGLERELLNPGRDVTPATLAFDYKQLSFLNSKCHGMTSIGEQKANIHWKSKNDYRIRPRKRFPTS
jgi:hypothetical protein